MNIVERMLGLICGAIVGAPIGFVLCLLVFRKLTTFTPSMIGGAIVGAIIGFFLPRVAKGIADFLMTLF